MDQWELQWVSDYLYKREYGSNETVYLTPRGLKVLKYKGKRDNPTCKMTDVYTWDEFKITHFYYEKKRSHKGVIRRFSFILNGTPWFDKTWNDMINIIQTYTLDTPSKKNLLLRSLTQYINDPKQEILELKVADVIGFVPPNENLPEGGWQLPDSFYFVSGNEFREDIEHNIRKLCDYKIPPQIDIRKLFKQMYDVTTIDYKDYIFAYGMIAPFLFAMRSETKLMPLLALGGPGGKGKTASEELFTVKMWGNIPEPLGSAAMDSKPRVQGMFTGSTLPICADDCEDAPSFITGIFKRYTTSSERVRKLNPDQTKKMDCEYCSPAMVSFNSLPVMFEDPQFRQRILLLYIKQLKKQSEKWLQVYNSIPDQALGKYVLEQTKDLTFTQLVDLYYKQDTLGVKGNRQKAIVRLMQLGKVLMKEIFDIDLNLDKLPEVIKKTLMAGNEEITDLIQHQIKESELMFVNEDGGWENPNKRSWVHYPVTPITYKNENGYLITTNNIKDLERRLGKKKNLSLNNLELLLKTQWKTVKNKTFYTPELTKSGTCRGIFIPLIELDHTRELIEGAEEIEKEINLSQTET